MLKSTFHNVRIEALATAVPTKWVPLEDFVVGLDENELKRFKKNTGVEGRYDAGVKQNTSDFCYVAAEKLIEHKKVNREEIDLVVFVTQTADYRLPATACVLHKRLGLTEDCLCFDVNQGCVGLIYGLNITCSMMESANIRRALLLVGDTSGKVRRRNIKEGSMSEDNNDAKLFGDAGMAMLLKKEDKAPQIDVAIRTDGGRYQTIVEPYGMFRHVNGPRVTEMDGVDVCSFAIDKPPLLVKEMMQELGTKPEDYDCLAMHQANRFIMKQVAKRSGFKPEQSLISIDQFANTSSASIATALTKHYGEAEEEGMVKAMLCAFGVGLAWGCASVEIDKKDILPLIKTDEYYEDGYEDICPDILE